MQLARMAGVPSTASTDLMPYVISDVTRNNAAKRFGEIIQERGRGLLAVNINASELSFARRWPLEYFEAVVRQFAIEGYHILLVGSASESPYVQRLVDKFENCKFASHVHNIAGYFSLEQFIAFLPTCDLLLSNDTGIMNFGYVVNVPTIGIYGPNTPIRYHVDNGMHTAAYNETYCSPCIHHLADAPCGDTADCMRGITVEEVIAMMNDSLAKKIRTPNRRQINAGDNEPFGVLRAR